MNSAFCRWATLICEGSEAAGRPLTRVRDNYKRWMEEAGFENVVERYFYWPVGAWAEGEYYKTLGAIFQHNLLAALEGMSLKALGMLGRGEGADCNADQGGRGRDYKWEEPDEFFCPCELPR